MGHVLVFESPSTLAVAKPPIPPPTSRPHPIRYAPHSHWTLLQQVLSISHQPIHTGQTSYHPLLSSPFVQSVTSIPKTRHASQRSTSSTQRFPLASHHSVSRHSPQLRPGSYFSHNLTHLAPPFSSASVRSFCLFFVQPTPQNFRQFQFCVPLCVRASSQVVVNIENFAQKVTLCVHLCEIAPKRTTPEEWGRNKKNGKRLASALLRTSRRLLVKFPQSRCWKVVRSLATAREKETTPDAFNTQYRMTK